MYVLEFVAEFLVGFLAEASWTVNRKKGRI